MKQYCKNCKYHYSNRQCRRHAPQLLIKTSQADGYIEKTIFPTMYDNDWCGDFERKDKK